MLVQPPNTGTMECWLSVVHKPKKLRALTPIFNTTGRTNMMNTFVSISRSQLLLLTLCALSTDIIAAPASPAKPNLSWQETNLTLNNGSVNVPINWNMWWGTNGNEWQLSQNGVVVHTAALNANGQNAQSGSKTVAVTAAGTYDYIVSLCNVVGSERSCTASDKRTITVTGSGGPGTPGGFDPWTQLNFAGWPKPMQQQNVPYQNTSNKMVGAYFVEWGIYGRNYHAYDIPAKNLTHLFYGFIPVCGPNASLQRDNPQGYSALQAQCQGKPNYTVMVHDKWAALDKGYPNDKWDQPIKGLFAEMYRLKKTNPHLKILPSVGGWTLSDPLYDIGTNATHRATFVASMVQFIKTYDFFDGIDIDWEFPGGGGANAALGSPQDGAGFVLLMRDLRQALDTLSQQTGRSYQLTAAMSGGVPKLSQVDWESAHSYMDYINVMTYDYYGAWNSTLGHMTGLYPNPSSPLSGFSAQEAVDHLLARQVPAGKITIGAAMYGRGWKNVSNVSANNPFSGSGGEGINGSWEKGIEDYKKIETQMMGGTNGSGANGFGLFWDDTGKASFVWNPATKTLVSFDTKRSVQAKGEFIRQRNLGGIFAWELDGDNGQILNAMHEGLGHPKQ
ncbi:MAG: chitinase [Gammaproteobacteria bacterium]|nr:chitinase [Gammaproteobacteria bacterium]